MDLKDKALEAFRARVDAGIYNNNDLIKKDCDIYREAFLDGYMTVLMELESKKESRGKYSIFDFIDKSLDFSTKYFLTGVYHDHGTMVVTNSMYMLVDKNCTYDTKYESKIIGIDSHKNYYEIKGNFPSYSKVMRDLNEMILTDINFADFKTARSLSTSKLPSKLECIHVYFADYDIKLSLNMVDVICRFVKLFPEAKFYCYEDKNKIMVLEYGDKTLWFMPLSTSLKPTHVVKSGFAAEYKEN